MPKTMLPDRGLVEISGEDAAGWLQSIVTCDVASLPNGQARLGALLSPQGKILFDFLVFRGDHPNGQVRYDLDANRASSADLVKRLMFYRLKAKVTITDFSAPTSPLPLYVVAEWNQFEEGQMSYADPRHPFLGRRIIHEAEEAFSIGDSSADYHAHRIALGIPEGGRDFSFGETFPHEALMDRLGGIDFHKGCYIGQEVVSRMRHRGAARTRIIPIAFTGPAPRMGEAIRAGDKVIGAVGSIAGNIGLAMVRIDRLEEAISAGLPFQAGAATITPRDLG